MGSQAQLGSLQAVGDRLPLEPLAQLLATDAQRLRSFVDFHGLAVEEGHEPQAGCGMLGVGFEPHGFLWFPIISSIKKCFSSLCAAGAAAQGRAPFGAGDARALPLLRRRRRAGGEVGHSEPRGRGAGPRRPVRGPMPRVAGVARRSVRCLPVFDVASFEQ